MLKRYALAGIGLALSGCAVPAASWKGPVEWPDERSAQNLSESLEAGAVLAAAGAIRELVRNNTDPRLFRGCSSPEQGLEVSIFTGPTPGLYYVILDQRFERCGGPSGRVLDWWHVYAVTPQGEVVARAPPSLGEAAAATPPHSPEQAPVPAAPPPETGAGAPTPVPPQVAPPTPTPVDPAPMVPSPTSPQPSTEVMHSATNLSGRVLATKLLPSRAHSLSGNFGTCILAS